MSLYGALGLLVALSATQASAAPKANRLLMLRIEQKDFPVELIRAFERAMREEAREVLPLHQLLPAPTLKTVAMRMAAGCADDKAACLASIGNTLDASGVVSVNLSGTTKRAWLSVTYLDLKSKKPATATAEMENVDLESEPEFRWYVAQALGAKRAPLSGRVELKPEPGTSLQGAVVRLDDKPIALEGLDNLPTKASQRRIDIEKVGAESFVWTGAIRPLRTTTIRVRLDEKKLPLPPNRQNLAVGSVTSKIDQAAGGEHRSSEGLSSAHSSGEHRAEVSTTARSPMAKPSEPRALLYTWILGGGSLIAGTTAVIFGLRARSLSKDCEETARLDPPRPCIEGDAADTRFRDGERAETIQWIGVASAGVLGGAALLAFVFEDGWTLFGGDEARPRASSQVSITPMAGGAAFAMRLSF